MLDQYSPGIPPGRLRHPLTVDSDLQSPVATAAVPPAASITEPQVRTESVMPQEIVRIVRTSQGFASCEATKGDGHGEIEAMIDDPKIVAKRLKNLRLALGFPTQVAFAEELGIEKNTYNPFEKGARELSFETACLIRKKFKIPIDPKCECGHSYLKGQECSNQIWHIARQFAEEAADKIVEDMAESYKLFQRDHMAAQLKRAVIRQTHPILIDTFEGVESACPLVTE